MNTTATASDLPSTSTDWFSVAAVTLGSTAFAVGQGLTYPLITLILAERGVDEATIGWNAATYMVGLGMSVLFVPWMMKRLRAGQMIVAGLFGAALVLGGFASTEALWIWFVLRFALGFSVNAVFMLGEAWLNAATADRIRGRIVGVYSAGMALGFVIGPLAIPLFGIQQGWAFASCAVLVSLAAFVIALLSRRATVEPEPSVLSDILVFVRKAPLLVFLVVTFGFVDASVLSMGPLLLIADGATAAVAAIFVAVLHGGMIVAQPVLGLLLDRYDRWSVGLACLLGTAALFGALSVIPTDSIMLWPLTALCGAAFFGIYTSALAILGQEHRGPFLVAGSGVFSLAYAAGGVVGPAALGTLLLSFPSIGFWPVTAFCLVAATLIAVGQRQ